MIGAFALAVVMLGSSACSTEPTADAGGTTTTTAAESDTTGETTGTTETTTLGDGDGDPTEDTSPGVSFYAGPDDDLLPVTDCDPFAQDCVEGEKCVAYESEGDPDINTCVPITGNGQAGEPCTYGGLATPVDDCDQDTACFFVEEVDGQLLGVCTAFCSGSPEDPICDDGTGCYLGNGGSINMCVPSCHPLMQDCADAQACVWHTTNALDGNTFGCLLEGPAATGEPCEAVDQCGAGDTCVMANLLPACDGGSCCAEFCDVADPDFQCALPGTQCLSFWPQGEPVPGYEGVGVCVVP